MKVDFPEKKDFELVPTHFGEDIDKEIEQWLHESIRTYRDTYQTLFQQKVPEWRRICEGKPREKEKSFPWPNCSNLIVQVAGQRVDDLAARVLGIVWATSPVALFRYFVVTDDPHRQSEKKRILEQFIDQVAYPKDELDLFRAENIGFPESAKLGTHFFKLVPDRKTQVSAVGYDEKAKRTKLEGTVTYNGPKVENLEFEHVMGDPKAANWEKSRLKTHKRILSKHELEERAFSGFYDKEEVAKIMDKPDRHGPDMTRQRQQSKKGVNQPQSNILAEWDVEECTFWWFVTVKGNDGKPVKLKVDLIWSYHYETRTLLRKVFNFMPDNACAIIPTKLNMGDKGIHGRGYADILENSQEEISTQHNQRIDARTMAITGIIRSSNPAIDKNIKVFPFCVIPGEKDEIELLKNPMDIGDGGIQDEELALRLADERAAVGPATTAMGAGGINKKGQYGGSMGTLAVMTASDSRPALRTSDFRHAHVELVSLATAMYGKFGIGQKGSMFGLDDDLLKEALADFTGKKVRIPVRAATASANKEVEKQNLMLLKASLQQHNDQKIKLVQALQMNAALPPFAKKLFIDTIKSQDVLMRQVIREFGVSDQPEEYVPDVDFPPELDENAKKKQQARGPEAGIDPRLVSMATAQPQPGPSVPAGGGGGMGDVPGGPGGPSNGNGLPPS